MKKRRISLVLSILAVVSLVACQGTPEKGVVIDKSEGFPKERIIEIDNETPKDLGIPKHWNEMIEQSDGFVTLEADCEMNLPEIYNTPVESYKMKKMDEEQLEMLCDYFADGNRLYEYPKMTKEELLHEKNKMENCEGRWSIYAEPYMRLYAKQQLEKMDTLIASAPEKKQEKEYVQPKFQKPYQTERDFQTGTSEYYVETEEDIGFVARIDEGEEIDPYIRVLNFNENVGSVTSFLFQQGTSVDETELKALSSDNEDTVEGYEKWWNSLKDGLEKEANISKEDAEAVVRKTLNDLKIEELEIVECVKAYSSEDSESWGLLDEPDIETSVGYAFYLSRKAGDLLGYHQRYHVINGDVPETVYAPYFKVETLYMVVTENGIQQFEWVNMSEKTVTVAENTKLLSFEEIKEKLADHLLYSYVANDGEALKKEGTGYKYKVRNVQLRAANVNAFEKPSEVWLVPVWVFELEGAIVNEEMGIESGMGIIPVVLNAIDGGFVTIRTEE